MDKMSSPIANISAKIMDSSTSAFSSFEAPKMSFDREIDDAMRVGRRSVIF